ncbi:MAG: hypothetical protein V9H69_17105 [Anaerolineae bacterium]
MDIEAVVGAWPVSAAAQLVAQLQQVLLQVVLESRDAGLAALAPGSQIVSHQQVAEVGDLRPQMMVLFELMTPRFFSHRRRALGLALVTAQPAGQTLVE